MGDTTCLPPQGGGWLYLIIWLGCYLRKVSDWDCMTQRLSARPCVEYSWCATHLRGSSCTPTKCRRGGTCGSPYTTTCFKDLLAHYGAYQSMSRRGNYYDNAYAESFWSRFKAELLDGGSFPGLAEAKLEISHHIVYYNAERWHFALGYLAPSHFTTLLQPTP